jgi:hypothetical protein
MTDCGITRWTYREAWPTSKTKQREQKRRRKMAVVIALAVVPLAVMASVWTDVQAVQETIEQRKQDASQLGMPGDYHTLYDEARQEDRT